MSDCKCPFCEAGYPVSKPRSSSLYEFQQRVIQKALEQSSKSFIIDSMPDLIVDGRAYDFKTKSDDDSRRKSNMGLSLIAGAGVYDQFVSRRVYIDTEASYYKPVIWDLRPNPTLVDMEPLYLVPDLRSSTTLYRPLVDGLTYLQGDLWSIWTLTSKLPEDRFSSYKRMYSLWSEHFASYFMPMEMEVRSFGNGLGLAQMLAKSLWTDGIIFDESHVMKGSVRNVEKDSKPFYQKKNEAHLAQNRFGNSFKS